MPLRIVIADICALPFPNDTFDCLYTIGTIEHTPQQDSAFAEIARVLKKGGTAIVGVPNKWDPFLFAAASRLLQAVGRYPYGYECWYTNGELSRQLEARGLHVLHRDGILFLPWFLRFVDLYLWLHSPSACRLSGVLVELFRKFSRARWLVRRFGYLTICVVQK